MAMKVRFEGLYLRKSFIPVCISMLLVCGGSVFAEDGQSAPVAARYRVHPMKKILAERGVEYLREVGINVTTSKLKGTNTLLVTSASQLDLAKASAILNLVDSTQNYAIAPVATVSEAGELPTPDQLQKELPDIAIGTFLSPPKGERPIKAIMDVHDEMIIVVVPSDHLERFFAALDKFRSLRKAPAIGPTAEVVIEPNKPWVESAAEPEAERKESEADELFGDLLESLDADRTRKITAPRPPAPVVDAIEVVERPKEQPVEKVEVAPGGDEDLAEQLRKLMQQQGRVERELVPAAEAESEEETGITVEVDGKEGKEIELPESVTPPTAPVQSYEPKFDFDPEEELNLQLPEKLEIITLLDLAGKYLHLDYIYDEAELKGQTVNLKLNGELSGYLKLKQLYPLVETTLIIKNFVMTRYGNIVWITNKDNAALKGNVPIIGGDGAEQIEAGGVIVNRVFKLEYIDTTNAKSLLDGIALQITEVPEQGVLFVVGYTSQMARMERLLQIVDKPGKPKKFRFRQLQYTLADSIAPKIESLAEQLGTVSITIAQTTPTVARAPQRGRVVRPPVRQPPRGAPPPASTTTPSQPTVYLDADARTNRILMIGLDEQLDIVEELIISLDVEQQDLRMLRLYDMQYVEAEDVRIKLEELGIVSPVRQTTRTGAMLQRRQQTTRPGQPQQGATVAAQTPAGATVDEILAEEPQVVIIEATNSLLVNATAAQQAQIAMIIGYVDSETLEAAKPYRIYSLENQNPVTMAETLTKLIQESIKDATGKIEQITKKTQEEIVIVPDENTFSLIVYASKKNQEWIANLIKHMDRRRPQVLIDVTLVEVSRGDEFEYDLNLIESFPNLENTSGLANTLVSDSDGNPLVTTNDILTSLSTAPARDRYIEYQSNSGQGIGFYADKHITALLTMIQTKNYGRILAKPKILVNDNESGTIKTTETTYISITGAVATEGGAAVSSQDYQSYDAGITLEITPHISEGDLLRLEIILGRSDFVRKVSAIERPPDTVATDLDTIVTVPDGSTIILGGLLKLNQTKGGSKVPILGDLPLVGGLFRSISNSDSESKLYIFVKANILRPEEGIKGLPEMERISDENRAAFEEFEDRFQTYEDWPGIKSRPMPPVKVLEAR